MSTIDNYHIVREVISHHFRTKGIITSFLPKIDGYGSGCHFHLSLWKNGKNVIGDPTSRLGVSPDAESFIAGILNNYEALFHFLCPSPNSIRRMLPSKWVGVYKCWGVENKEAPIRLCSSSKASEKFSNFEIKSFDHTANHYFALAAIIALGMNGIRNHMKLPEPINEDPADLSED